MRIGIFVDAYKPYISGVVTSVDMLEEGLKKLGHEVFIFTVNLEGEETVLKNNIVYFKGKRVRIKSLSNYKLVFKKKDKIKFIKQYNLDVIHIHNEFSVGRIGLLCSKKLKIPMVYTFHTLYEEYIGYFSSFLDKHFHFIMMKILRSRTKPLAKHAKYVILPTDKVSKLAHRYGIKKNYEIIPTGINLDKFKVDNADFVKGIKKEYNITNEFIFLSLGRISEEKSLDIIVNAFKKIHNKIDAKLIFVGNGPYYDKIVSLVEELKLTDNVIFTGSVSWDLVPKYYQVADLMLNASKSETQGLTNIEALASGIPLLVQSDKSVENLIKVGYNGYTFDGVDELAEKMLNIYKNKTELISMKNNCRKSVEIYSNTEYAKRVLELYEKSIKVQ